MPRAPVLDPRDLHLVGFQWMGTLFYDKVLTMGLRSSPQIWQRVTTAVSYMYYKRGYMAVNYFGGAETKEKANGAYELLGYLLEN